MGEIVNVSVSIWYHGPSDFIRKTGFVNSKEHLLMLPSEHCANRH